MHLKHLMLITVLTLSFLTGCGEIVQESLVNNKTGLDSGDLNDKVPGTDDNEPEDTTPVEPEPVLQVKTYALGSCTKRYRPFLSFSRRNESCANFQVTGTLTADDLVQAQSSSQDYCEEADDDNRYNSKACEELDSDFKAVADEKDDDTYCEDERSISSFIIEATHLLVRDSREYEVNSNDQCEVKTSFF